jgi:hypothetical protein
MRMTRFLTLLALQIAVLPTPTLAAADRDAPKHEASLADFAALEARGLRIGEIRIVTGDIFDLSDPAENNALFRFANLLHARSKPQAVADALLFRSGERLSLRAIEETERVLRGNRNYFDVRIRPLAVHEDRVDIEVATRDTWTLDIGARVSREGGSSSGGFVVRDSNLFGSGVTLGIGRSSDADRSGSQIEFAYPRAFDGRSLVAASYADNSDGKRLAASVVRPFTALDDRWAAGVSVLDDDRVESLYFQGEVASKYRRRDQISEAWGGWSTGLINGWTRRNSFGIRSQRERYGVEPGEIAPPVLSADRDLVYPFVRYEVIEERFERQENRNQMGRPEFFALGLVTRFELGRAVAGWGDTAPAWVYSASVSRGFEPSPAGDLFLAASLRGQHDEGGVQRQVLGASGRYYHALGPRWLLYAGLSGERAKNPALPDLLTLGGENGLRGYPLRYQTGERRAVLTLEARSFSDLYLYRLFRIGAAAFVDVGSAWGGPLAEHASPHWLANVGVGLRIFSVRSAFGNVLHLDLAKPLDDGPGVKSLQFQLKSKTSF